MAGRMRSRQPAKPAPSKAEGMPALQGWGLSSRERGVDTTGGTLQLDGWAHEGRWLRLLLGVFSHLCSLKACRASADGAAIVGTSRGMKSRQAQALQAQPLKNAVCIQIKFLFASAIRAALHKNAEGWDS